MKPLLVFVEGLSEMERSQKWDDACVLLYNKWVESNREQQYLVRTMLEAWYAALEHGTGVVPEDINLSTLTTILQECVLYGHIHHSSDLQYLWAICHILNISGSMFMPEIANSWDAEHKAFMKKGFELFHDNEFGRIVFSEYSSIHEQDAAHKSIHHILPSLFPHDTELERYFLRLYNPIRNIALE